MGRGRRAGGRRMMQVGVAIVGLIALVASSCADGTAADRCDRRPPEFGSPVRHGDHVSTEVRFQSGCVMLAGTLYQPLTQRAHPVMVFLHGSGETPRLGFGGPWITTPLIEAGIAVMTYDKRGVGASGGRCCIDVEDDFETLTADGVAAVRALEGRADVGPIGLLGVSQGGWVIPKIVARAEEVSFTVIFSGSAVSVGEEILYSRLTGGHDVLPPSVDAQDVNRRLREEGPSRFDPRPLLRTFPVPGLWIYGARDGSQPSLLGAEILARIKTEAGRDFTVKVFPSLGHDTTHDPGAIGFMLSWLDETLQVGGGGSSGR